MEPWGTQKPAAVDPPKERINVPWWLVWLPDFCLACSCLPFFILAILAAALLIWLL